MQMPARKELRCDVCQRDSDLEALPLARIASQFFACWHLQVDLQTSGTQWQRHEA